jgi:hypothetical protein
MATETTEARCLCGHPRNMHFGGQHERCMKIITMHHSGNVVCTCKTFTPDDGRFGATPPK